MIIAKECIRILASTKEQISPSMYPPTEKESQRKNLMSKGMSKCFSKIES